MMKQSLFLAAILVGNITFAGMFLDDFNRANTVATTDGSVIGSTWDIVGNAFSIYQENLQFKGATANNYIYNTHAGTTADDFVLKVDLVHNNAANEFNYNIGAVWGIGSKDGTDNDGWAVRFGDDIWQVLRIHDGSLASLGTGTMNGEMLQGVAYTLTVSSTANQAWNFSVDRTGDSVNFGSFSASDGSALTASWTGGYGGVFYNNNVSQSRADNFSVDSPDAIGNQPSSYEMWTNAKGLIPGLNDAPTDNPDAAGGSLLNNLAEFGLGGDPLDAADEGFVPTFRVVESLGTNWMAYVYPKLLDPDSGLDYYLELTDDLMLSGSWTNAGYSVTGEGEINTAFNAVTNTMPAASASMFVRLVISASWTAPVFVDFVHLEAGDVGSVGSDFYYETSTPYGDEVVWGWDLISEPTVPITGAWGNKTGLYVPAPYGDHGLGRSSSQPTTYIQIYSNEVGICLDVQPGEVASQTYNPNVKFYYFWNWGNYGEQASTGWLYPFHSTYSNANPRLQCSFDAAVKTSFGTGVRHANTSFQWVDEESGSQIYVQHYVYDNRGAGISDVNSGIDPKINKLWLAQKVGAPGAYCSTLEGSSVYTGTVWPEYEYFGIDTSWSQFEEMIVYLNNRHGTSLGLDRDKWRLASVSFNFEMQWKFEGSMGGKVKDMKVWTLK